MNEQDTSPIEADPIVAEEKGFWTLDRIIIYSLLAIGVVMALNDYRIRSKWESDFSELDAAVTMAKTPGVMDAADADSTLVATIRSGAGASDWMGEHGYVIDDSRSSKNVQVFSTSSGIRTFFLNVDVHLTGRDAEQREDILAVSREAFYAWNGLPENEKERTASEVAGEEGSQAGPEMTSMGGGGGPGGGGGRSFDPEQIFADRDKDKDGLLSGDEISERMQPRIEEIDEDEDGAISKDEFLKAMAAIMASRQQGRGGGGGGGRGGEEAAAMSLPDDPYEQGELGFPDANALPEEIEKLKKKLDAGQ